jgi:hypothetical protein
VQSFGPKQPHSEVDVKDGAFENPQGIGNGQVAGGTM